MSLGLQNRVKDLMVQNRRSHNGRTFTVPSPERYPFQWLWDSCFHAIILSHFDMVQAREEIRALLTKSLTNGLVPHMIYWDEMYQAIKWGREGQGDIISKAWGTIGTSSITQPPLLASVVWQLHEREHDTGYLREVYPALRAHYLSLMLERSFEGNGLLGIINPDESGEDNSPRFDLLQNLPVKHTPEENLDRRLVRMREHATCEFKVLSCTRHHFWVEDVTFNAIAVGAFEALSSIAHEIGEPLDAHTFTLTAKQIASSMNLYMKHDYRYYSLMGETREKIHIETWDLFMPLYAGVMHKEEAKLLIERHFLDPNTFATPYPIPSVSLREPSYTKDDLWRGPTWVGINWFVYKGLSRYGYHDLARELRAKTCALIEQSGFREHYDPVSGKGYGAHDFTWGGLVIDMVV